MKLYEFSSKTCGPCKAMVPIIEKLKAKLPEGIDEIVRRRRHGSGRAAKVGRRRRGEDQEGVTASVSMRRPWRGQAWLAGSLRGV